MKTFNLPNMIKLLYTSLAMVAVFSCQDKQKAKADDKHVNEDSLGAYIYLDKDSTFHSDKNCTYVCGVIPEDAEERRFNGVKRLDTANVMYHNIRDMYFCPSCFSDKQYEHIINRMLANESYVDKVIRHEPAVRK